MTTQDLGIYLMVWLISSALIWLLDVEECLSIVTKIIVPIVLTLFVILMRIAIFLMIGE